MLFGNNLQKTIVGHLEQRPSRSKEIKELFRFVICAKWPETASYSARHYYAIVVTHHIGFKIAVCAQNYYFSRITQVLYTKYNLLGRLNKMACPDANFFTLIHSVLKFIFFDMRKKVGPIRLHIRKNTYLCTAIENDGSSVRPDGGIGRRAGLKHQWIHFHPGSTPGLGTKKDRLLIERLTAFLFLWTIHRVAKG